MACPRQWPIHRLYALSKLLAKPLERGSVKVTLCHKCYFSIDRRQWAHALSWPVLSQRFLLFSGAQMDGAPRLAIHPANSHASKELVLADTIF